MNLRPQDISRLEEVYSLYSKTESTYMKFHDVMVLLVERRFLSNNLTIDKIIPIYEEALDLTLETEVK